MNEPVSTGVTVPNNLTEPRSIAVSGALVKAIVGVMKLIKEVRKAGWNKEGKYEYVMMADVMASIQDALVANELVLSQREVSRVIAQKIVFIGYQFDVHHGGGGSIINIGSHTGACRFEFKSGTTDDKAVSKAYVSAHKYFCLNLFKIPPDDHQTERMTDIPEADAQGERDPDDDRRNNRRISDDRDTRDSRRDEPQDRRADPRREDEDRRGAQRDRRDPPDDDQRIEDRRRDDDRRRAERDEREPPRDERPREGRADQPSNADPWDGPPAGRWDDPPPADVDLPPRASEPPAGRWDDAPPYGAADEPSPPPRDPAEASGRARVIAFKEAFEKAISEDAAHDIWRQEEKLLASLADTTHDHLVAAYERKWGIYPPKLRG